MKTFSELASTIRYDFDQPTLMRIGAQQLRVAYESPDAVFKHIVEAYPMLIHIRPHFDKLAFFGGCVCDALLNSGRPRDIDIAFF